MIAASPLSELYRCEHPLMLQLRCRLEEIARTTGLVTVLIEGATGTAKTTTALALAMALETKARFISQVITGDNALRRSEYIGSQELSYAEVKAIASGNPAVFVEADASEG